MNPNVGSHLPAMAAARPDLLAVAVQLPGKRQGKHVYSEWTLRQLNDESDRLAHGFERIGIRAGVRTVLMVTPGLAFFAATFALFKTGAVPVIVDPGMGLSNLKQCLDEAEPEAFIGIPKAHAARVLFGWARRTLRTNVTAGRRLFWDGPTLDELSSTSRNAGAYAIRECSENELAAILFTSGSTGIPKGTEYTHGIFHAQVEILRNDYGIQPGERDLSTFPLFALFGPALGMASIVPDMDASRPAMTNPQHIIAAIEDYGATNLFASPALLEIVGAYGQQHGIRFPSLRRVISAGAPAEIPSVERFCSLLNADVEVIPSYGATEALPIARIGSRELLPTQVRTNEGGGICVGRPVQSAEIRILRISDDAMPAWKEELRAPQGEIGEIAVRGPMVTARYYKREDSTRLAKIADTDGTFWHRMGDLGYFDAEGRLWMCGRKSHRVITSEGTLFTLPCERVFNVVPCVKRTALVGVPGNSGQEPVLCVELNPECRSEERSRIRKELLELGSRFDHTKQIRTILFHPRFPVDVRHNAKIFRENLAAWAGEQIR